MKSLEFLLVALVTSTTTGCYGGRLLADYVGNTGYSSDEATTTDAGSIDDAGLPGPEQGLLDRWNAVVAANPWDSVAATGWVFDFYWPTFGEFPHPTYKGGYIASYQEFSRLLLIFMQTGDNFDFLVANNLFDIAIGEATESGAIGDGWTFRELVDNFASYTSGPYGCADASTRAGLKAIKTKLAALG